MARLVGVDLPRDKRIEVALTYIYGIGRTRAQEVLAATGVNPDLRVHELGDEERGASQPQIEQALRPSQRGRNGRVEIHQQVRIDTNN